MEDRLSALFNNAASNLNNLFKEGNSEIEDSKLKGKKEIYQNTLNWMIKKHEGDLKFVKLEDLVQMLKNECSVPTQPRSSNFATKKYKPCNEN